MTPALQVLVTLGAWAQMHSELVLACSGAVVLLLGLARLTWRTAIFDRRPRP